MNNFCFLKDLEITGSDILLIMHWLQRVDSPSGSSIFLWHDVLLLMVLLVLICANFLHNSIVPWDDIRELVANHLIALKKCPVVRSIRVGETL